MPGDWASYHGARFCSPKYLGRSSRDPSNAAGFILRIPVFFASNMRHLKGWFLSDPNSASRKPINLIASPSGEIRKTKAFLVGLPPKTSTSISVGERVKPDFVNRCSLSDDQEKIGQPPAARIAFLINKFQHVFFFFSHANN